MARRVHAPLSKIGYGPAGAARRRRGFREERVRPVKVLLVEDDEVDRLAVRRAFAKHGVANEIVEAMNGREALEALRGGAGRAPLERPYVILLDLNMPVMNGVEFLDALRADPALSDAVVFVLSTSRSAGDVTEAHRRNVAGYIAKSNAGDGFREAVRLLESYWRLVELPESFGARLA
jgi:CheY-like chemotaxis protein